MAESQFAQTPLQCDLCGNDHDVIHFCPVCEETMCSYCKAIHNKGKATKDHKVVPRGQIHVKPKESATQACRKHPGQTYHLFCEDCQEPMCSACFSENHKRHSICQLPNAIIDIKNKISAEVDHMETQTVPDLQKTIDLTKRQSQNFVQQCEEARKLCSEDMESFKVMMREVIEIYEGYDEKLKITGQHEKNRVKSIQQDLVIQISDLNKQIEIYRGKVKCQDDLEVINFWKSRSSLDRLNAIPSPPFRAAPSFQSSILKKSDMIGKLGKIVQSDQQFMLPKPDSISRFKQGTDIKFMSSFTVNNSCYPCVSASAGGEAWVAKRGTSKVELVNTWGDVKLSVTIAEPRFLAAFPSGEVLVVNNQTRSIHRIFPTGKKEVLMKTDPWTPQSVGVSAGNHFLLCQYTDNTGMISRHTLKGKVKQTIQPADKDGSPLLRDPLFIAETSTGNICVSDCNVNKLFIFNQDGDLLFTYDGSAVRRQWKYRPRGLCIDKTGNILVVDYSNDCIDLLSKEGRFLQELLTKENSIKDPWDLSIDDQDNLWVASRSRIQVFKYLQ